VNELLTAAVMFDYYSTLDVMIAERLESGEVNRIREEIGDGALVAIADFFTAPDGPRIRDRMSHGVRYLFVL
jgi:hypothetical protein